MREGGEGGRRGKTGETGIKDGQGTKDKGKERNEDKDKESG